MRRIALTCLLLTGTACSSGGIPAMSTALTGTTAAPVTTNTGLAVSTTTTTTAATTTTTAAPPEGSGAQGLGDPYFPSLGNGGYDVGHYDITISVDPVSAELDATTTITAVAEASLATFNLDLLGLEVSSVTVNGVDASYVREGPELRVSPVGGIVEAEEFSVAVAYSGLPQAIEIVSADLQAGWTQTPEGIYVLAEPDGARTWFPSNDHPSDKATFTFRITVPKPLTAAANGALIETIDLGDSQTFVWDLQSQTATYLATIVIGEYDRVESDGPDGVLIRDYLPTSFNGTMPPSFRISGEAIQFFSDWFGPYPFDRYGHIVVYDLGGAMETQTLVLMGSRALLDRIVVHELSHQWWGDSVTPASWQDIWLNEGFATFAEFLWTEHTQGRQAMLQRIEGLYDSLRTFDHAPISDPGEAELLAPAVYWRGGITLHALRLRVGDAVLKDILWTYHATFAGGNATTGDFISLAEEVSGQDLGDLFDAWLFAEELPSLPSG